eukprot:SAG11_NODE_922_length_6540_cov_45.267816_3_plen_83_part_00
MPYDQQVLLIVDGDYSHVDNDESGASASDLARSLQPSPAYVQDSSKIGCLDYVARCGIYKVSPPPYTSGRVQKEDARKGNNQ